MVSASPLIRIITEKLKAYKADKIVVDPVMVATSGSRLISDEAIETLKECLLPMASVLTPNIPEAEVLSGLAIETQKDMVAAAGAISRTYSCAVLLKEAIRSMMPMTFCTGKILINGSMAGA